MTAAIYRNGMPALSVPQTQNTAPVLEFNCLYTHDIRRKAKRWQDGFLRYHTFNKRVMVYDVPRNYIGDTHWTSDGEVADGDELTLDKAGVLVQVAEAVGRTETDLTELRASTKKARGDGSSPVRAPQTQVVPRLSNAEATRQPHQLKHRSLNALLGTPRTPIGKAALPSKSPFEIRHENVENEAWEEGRPPKRQRLETQDVTRSITAPKALLKELPLWARTTEALNQRDKAQFQPVQRKVANREIADRREDHLRSGTSLQGFSSDAPAPFLSPSRQKKLIQRQSGTESSSPAFQTQKTEPKLRNESLSKLAAAESQDTAVGDDIDHAFIVLDDSDGDNSAAQPRKSPTRSRILSQSLPKLPGRARCSPAAASDQTQSGRPGSTLRVAARAHKKKGLLCQDQLTSQPKRKSSTDTEAAADRLLDATSDDESEQPKKQSSFVENRLARIKKKEAAAARRSKVSERQIEKNVGSARHGESAAGRSCAGVNASLTDMPSDSSSAIELARLDRMILPSAIAVPHTRSTNDSGEASRVSPVMETHDHPPADSRSPSSVPTQPELMQPCPSSLPRDKATRRKISKKKIRASAAACFKPPDLSDDSAEHVAGPLADDRNEDSRRDYIVRQNGEEAAVSPTQTPAQSIPASARDVAKAGPAYGTFAKPKRIPGAPMRFTPSPPKGMRQAASTTTIQQAASLDQREASPPGGSIGFTRSAMPSPGRPGSREGTQQAGALDQRCRTPSVEGAVSDRPAPVLPPPKSGPRKGLQKAVSPNTAASGTATVMLGRPFQPPRKTIVPQPKMAHKGDEIEDVAAPTIAPAPADPWSREAFDLFVWRPPGWDEEGWCFQKEGGQDAGRQ